MRVASVNDLWNYLTEENSNSSQVTWFRSKTTKNENGEIEWGFNFDIIAETILRAIQSQNKRNLMSELRIANRFKWSTPRLPTCLSLPRQIITSVIRRNESNSIGYRIARATVFDSCREFVFHRRRQLASRFIEFHFVHRDSTAVCFSLEFDQKEINYWKWRELYFRFKFAEPRKWINKTKIMLRSTSTSIRIKFFDSLNGLNMPFRCVSVSTCSKCQLLEFQSIFSLFDFGFSSNSVEPEPDECALK